MARVLSFSDRSFLLKVGRTIEAYLGANSPSEILRVLQEHPELLSDTADQLLESYAQDQTGRTRQTAEARLTFLRRCRKVGIEQGVAELQAGEIPPEVDSILRELSTPAQPASMPGRIQLCEQALQSVSQESNPPVWAKLQFFLGDSWYQNLQGGRAANIERAITAYSRSLEVRKRQTMLYEWADSMKRLGMVHVGRIRGQKAENLERAIGFHSRALTVNTRQARPEEWAHGMASLALAYAERIRGEPAENQERSIRHYKQALEVIRRQTTPELWATTLHNLATVYCRRIRGVTAENLESSLELLEQVLEVLNRKKTPYEWSNAKVNLANVYFDRIQGDRSENLERCIEHLEEAIGVRTRKAMPYAWAEAMTNLGNACSARLRGQPMENRERALKIYQEVLVLATREAMPEQWATTQLNLAKLYVERIEGGKSDNLERSIAAYDQVLSVFTEEAMPFRWALAISNMAEALTFRYEQTKREEDIERALELCGQALRIRTREAMPFAWAQTQSILARAYAERPIGPRAENLRRAIDACRQALAVRTLDTSPSRHRISANLLGKLCAEADRWSEAAKAFRSATAATEQLCRASLFRSSEQVERGQTGSLYRRAAEALARLGRAREAVVIAERGRARALGDALSRNQLDLARVRTADPQACDLYQKAVERLRSLESLKRSEDSSSADEVAALHGEDLRRDTRAARADLDEAIARIRRVPGYQDVLRELDFDDIAATVQAGQPLVYILPLEGETLALLLDRPHTDSEVSVESLWLTAIGARLNRGEMGEFPLQPPDTMQETVEVILERLSTPIGEGLLRPLAVRLQELSATGVVLIPGSTLGSMYPLHAIPYVVEDRESCLLDEFDVAYTPSAQVLAAARQTLAARISRPPLLVGAGNPKADSAEPLPYARVELEQITDLFDQGRSDVLYEQEVTRDALLEILPKADYVHLACHGVYDREATMAAQLLLTGKQTLRLRQLLELRPFDRNRLVVLSACTSATSQPFELADEMVGLPAGFLEAGAPAVIGTFWTVNDLSTALLMLKFYTYHLKGDAEGGYGPLEPAAALRRAQLWLRDVTAGELLALFDQQRALREHERQVAERGFSETEAARDTARFMLEDPEARPFASPYYWAPFLFLGA